MSTERRLREGGIVDPAATIAEAARAGLRLELACALLEKESSGGRNVFGHDPSIFSGAGEVTRDRYAAYKQARDAGAVRRMQGVGPCQLTWWELQDEADREGGCWRPEINMRVGFRHLARLIAAYGEASGTRRYNGSGADAAAYSRDLLARAAKWEARLAQREPRRAPKPHPEPVREDASLDALAAEVERLDAERDRKWAELARRGEALRREAEEEEKTAATAGARPVRRFQARRRTGATVTRIAPPPPPPPEGPNGPAPEAPAPASPVTDAELVRRLATLDRAEDHARHVLVRRYRAAERAVGRHKADEVVVTRQGDAGHLVRASKLALARFLAARGNPEHRALRRALRREAARRRRGRVATPRWERAVKAAQHVAGLAPTGVLDGELHKRLQPYWPRDSVVRRIVRTTPAWRTIPGQLSPNFNLRELACKDGTSYVGGLMREQGLTRRQAMERARGLARRLERVRRLDGNRPITPTSAFRTKAYNASLAGAASNSAHTRGYAVDMPPPRGVSLDTHHKHVRSAFESGVGYYPAGRGYFVHGDFDPTLGRRNW